MHCRAIMPQELVNNCLTCIKCAEALYSWLLWMFYHTYYQEGTLLFRDMKNKCKLIAWKIIPAWSTEAYCWLHLLKVQVKLNTYHWGLQWNSMVMQVKKATFQGMGSCGKGGTWNRWDVSGGHSSPLEVSYISTVSTSRSLLLTVRATTDVPGDTAECCSVSDISI